MAFEKDDKTSAPESKTNASVLSQQVQRLFPAEQNSAKSSAKITVYDTAPVILADDKVDASMGIETDHRARSHDAPGAAMARALGAWSSAYVSLDRRPITGNRLYPMKRVSSEALSELSSKSLPAYAFLDAELTRLKGQASHKGISTATSETSDDESMLATRIKTIKALKDQIPPGRMGLLQKIDFARLSDDTRAQKSFGVVTDFEKAQTSAIAEHQADMARLTSTERDAYANTRRATTASFCNDVGALFGAQAAELAIDWFAPRNVVSQKTIVADFIIPSIAMGMDMTMLGKWAPLARAGIMVGTHAAFHLAFDKQVDNNNK